MSGSLNNELNKQVFTSAYTSIEVKKYECKLGGGVSITKRRDMTPQMPDGLKAAKKEALLENITHMIQYTHKITVNI